MTIEKAPPKKKLSKIQIFKKPIIIGGTIAAVAIAGIISGIIILREVPKGGTLKVGIRYEVGQIDPLLYSTAAEGIFIWQVTETLFESEYIDGKSQIINNLATGWEWNTNYTELTCFLREGVKFHDGTLFDAAAVKWNFDRISRIIDSSNPLKYFWGHMFFFPNGRWIVNKTQVIDPYTVKFVLNDRFMPFLSFLTHATTTILSPTSTPTNETLRIQTDDLVGTGPFIYNGYDPNVNITLYSNQNYWGIKPKIDKIVLTLYPNSTTRDDDSWDALLKKEIHMLDEDFMDSVNKSIETLKNIPDIVIQEKPITNYQFIGMDNELINTTMRKAISYAVNYSKIIEILTNSVTPRSHIPEGIIYSNTTAIDIPYYNISKARGILIDAGWPGTEGLTANDNITTGNEWEQLVTNSALTPLAMYNLSYMQFYPITEGISRPLPENLKQIGVKLTRQNWLTTPYQLITLGWRYDYNDPHNGMMVDYHSKWTWVNLNDSQIDQWIEEGMKEPNPILREQIYFNIQECLIEDLFPVILASSIIDFEVYTSNLKGLQLVPFKTLLKTVDFI